MAKPMTPDPLAARVHALQEAVAIIEHTKGTHVKWRDYLQDYGHLDDVQVDAMIAGDLAHQLLWIENYDKVLAVLEAALAAAAPRHKPEKESMMALPDWTCARCGKRHPSDHAGMLDRDRDRWYCVDQTCAPPVDYQEALDALPDSLNRPLAERIRLLMDRANREARLAVALRMKLHDVAGAEVASSINVE